MNDRYQVRLEVGTRIPYMAPMPDGSWRLVRDECISWAPAGALDSFGQVAVHHRMLGTLSEAAAAEEPRTG